MRSKQIATLAGVTPRTVRHYRQIGLLPEPPRDGGGYRRYGVPHLIRLLRIKGLAAAGVPLGDMAAFLDGGGGSAEERLDTLDRQLVDQIAQLERQRALVARLRGGAQDEAFRVLSEGRSAAATEAWREQLTLFSHLLEPEELAKLTLLYERLAHDPARFQALGRRIDALGPDSDEAEIAALARDYLAYFGGISAEFAGVFATRRDLLPLIHAHTLGSANASQRRMFDLVAKG